MSAAVANAAAATPAPLAAPVAPAAVVVTPMWFVLMLCCCCVINQPSHPGAILHTPVRKGNATKLIPMRCREQNGNDATE